MWIVPKHVPTYSSSHMDSENIYFYLGLLPMSQSWVIDKKIKGQCLISIWIKAQNSSDLVEKISNYLSQNKLPKQNIYNKIICSITIATRQNKLNYINQCDSVTTDVVKTILFLTECYKTNNMRPFSFKSGTFFTCRDKMLTFDLFADNFNCKWVKLYIFWIRVICISWVFLSPSNGSS